MPEPTSHVVTPLPWPLVEFVQPLLRKLGHDMTNALVAGVTMADVLAMQDRGGALADQMRALRPYLLRPREVLQTAVGGLPDLGLRPRTWPELRRLLAGQALEHHVELRWLAPSSASALPTWLAEEAWCHAGWALVANALDAHAAAAELAMAAPAPWVAVRLVDEALVVSDNGSGCEDVAAVAAGQHRRRGGGHLGLGLPVLAAVVARAGGEVRLTDCAEGGIEARVQPRT